MKFLFSSLVLLSLVFVVYRTGITGTVSIDANGDRNADYSLLDMNEEGDFKVSVTSSRQFPTWTVTSSHQLFSKCTIL